MTKRTIRLAQLHNTVRPITVLMATIVVGVALLVLTHAATSTQAIQADAGTPVSPASRLQVAGASGSYAIKFGTNTSAATGKFYIVGKDIVDPDGNKFYPMGGNIAISGNYTFSYLGTAENHAVDAKNWGWNTMRLTMACGNDTSAVDRVIDEYTAQKIVVTIGCWDVTGADPSPSDSRVTNILNVFDRIAAKYKDNPYVWYNPLNEPLADGDKNAWLNLQNAALSRIRAKAPESIYVADVQGWAQGVQTLYGSSPVTSLGQGKCNILYSWHAYGAGLGDTSDQTKMDNAVRNVFINLNNANVPVILGEIGDPSPANGNDNGTGNNQRSARSAISLAPQYGYGLQWWHLTGDDNGQITFSLMQSKTAPAASVWNALTNTSANRGLSTTGLSFWNLSQNKPNLGKFTGNLSASSCASAQ